MSQFLKFLMAGGVRIGKGIALAADEVIPQHISLPLPFGCLIPEKSNHQKVVEVENERVLAAKKKPRLLRTEHGSGTHHSASPLNTIIPNEGELATGMILKPVNQTEEDTDQPLDNTEYTTKANSLLSEHSPQFQQSTHSDENTRCARSESCHTHASGSIGHGVSSTSGGSHSLAFPARHPDGDGAGSSLRRDADLPKPFVSSWNLTTILNDAESYRDMLINLATPARYESLTEDYRELFESHRSCQDVSDRLTETQNQLLDTVQSRNKLSEDHKALQQVHLGCVTKEADLTEKLAAVEKAKDDLLDRDQEKKERIKPLEADLASKTSSLAKAEGVVGTLKGDLKHLIVDLSQANIVRHNYVRQLLPTVAACYEEEAQAFLATADGYDPTCKETFMSEFDSLFDKSYPYVEKLDESFRLPLRDLQNMWLEGIGPTLSGNVADASNAVDAQ
nr:hypothetical protein [Tanacetum cinerariifolium]